VDLDRIRVRATFAGAKGDDARARNMTASRLALRHYFDIPTGVIEAFVGAGRAPRYCSVNRMAGRELRPSRTIGRSQRPSMPAPRHGWCLGNGSNRPVRSESYHASCGCAIFLLSGALLTRRAYCNHVFKGARETLRRVFLEFHCGGME